MKQVSNILELDYETKNGVYLVDFFASWCGPCVMINPIIEEAEENYKKGLEVIRVNVEKVKDLYTHFGVKSLPTIRIVKDGNVVWEKSGTISKDELFVELDKYALSKDEIKKLEEQKQKEIELAKPIQITSLVDLNKELEENDIVLIFLYAEWCNICKMMNEVVKKIVEKYTTRIKILKVDVDKNMEIVEFYDVNFVPVIKIFDKKKLLWEKLGFIQEKELLDKVESVLKQYNESRI